MNKPFLQIMNDLVFEAPHHPVHIILALRACGTILEDCLGWPNYPNLHQWLFKTMTLDDALFALKDTRTVLENLRIPYPDPNGNELREAALDTFKDAQHIRRAVLKPFTRLGREEECLKLHYHPEWDRFCNAFNAVWDIVVQSQNPTTTP